VSGRPSLDRDEAKCDQTLSSIAGLPAIKERARGWEWNMKNPGLVVRTDRRHDISTVRDGITPAEPREKGGREQQRPIFADGGPILLLCLRLDLLVVVLHSESSFCSIPVWSFLNRDERSSSTNPKGHCRGGRLVRCASRGLLRPLSLL
jgi:hypothetical protein